MEIIFWLIEDYYLFSEWSQYEVPYKSSYKSHLGHEIDTKKE